MSGYPGIQSYAAPHTPNQYDVQAATDWNNGPSIFIRTEVSTQSASRCAIKSGAEKAYANLAPLVSHTECAICDAAGNVYFTKDLSNYTGVVKFSPALVELADAGTPSSGQGDNIPLPSLMCVIAIGDFSWLVSVGLEDGSDFGPALGAVLLGDTLSIVTFAFNTDVGTNGTIIAGPSDKTTATVYVLIQPDFSSDDQSLALYTVLCTLVDATDPTTATFDVTKIGTIQANAIDPSWTMVANNGFVFDTTDNTLILNTTSLTGRAGYLVKIDPTDCSITWKVPIPDTSSDHDQFMMGRIKKGILSYFSQGDLGPKQIITINTKTGIYTTTTTGLLGLTASAQCCDDGNACIVAYGTYSKHTTGSAIPLNDTPDSFTGWYALFIEQIGAMTYTAVRILKRG